jgi:hypothetical protein
MVQFKPIKPDLSKGVSKGVSGGLSKALSFEGPLENLPTEHDLPDTDNRPVDNDTAPTAEPAALNPAVSLGRSFGLVYGGELRTVLRSW